MDAAPLLIKWARRFLGMIALIGLIACNPIRNQESSSDWQPNQVRSLDPAESTPNPISRIEPSQDLIALYSRESETELQIRLDVLDLKLNPRAGLPLSPRFDLYLEIYPLPIESDTWEFRIRVPSENSPSVDSAKQQSIKQIIPRVVYDQQLDMITVSIKRKDLPNLRQGYQIRAFTTAPSSSKILDEIRTISSFAHVEPAPLLLVFWNTLPAHTPAQALRRWDGAHTGPLGERHGLKHLLDASNTSQIPITLLDLKTPSSLAALDALGKSELIATMQRAGLLILPDALPESYFGRLPSWVAQRAADSSHRTGLAFGIADSPFWYAPDLPETAPMANHLGFTRSTTTRNSSLDSTQITNWQDQRVIALPIGAETKNQATAQGLPLDLRRALLQMALNSDAQTAIAILGGDLPSSIWGDPQAASATIKYIAQHPWMHTLDGSELINLSIYQNENCAFAVKQPTPIIQHPAMEALENAMNNTTSDLAWQMFLDLSAPATPQIPELANLRTNYLGQIGDLLAAVTWEGNPKYYSMEVATRNKTSVDCLQDTDFDGRSECILADERFFSLLDPDSGRLVLLLIHTNGKVVQLIGPSFQFAIGLSDYSTWDLSTGIRADPAVIPGAFADPWGKYQVEVIENGVRFIRPDIRKTYQLDEDGLRIEIASEQPRDFQIPLAVDPQQRFNPNWMSQYQESEIPQGWIWGIKAGPKVEIRSSGDLSSHSFQESQELLSAPENPNLGYPPGHFFPFPLAIIEIAATNQLWVEIRVIE